MPRQQYIIKGKIMAEISIIIPVYNVEQYLAECLDSVINQTLQDIEIICVDDGSTDGSADILKEYAIKDSRIKIILQKNKGAGAARNTGMQYATGKYYAFLDSDDFFEKDMLEKAYSEAEKQQADIVVFGCDLFINSKKVFEPCNYSIQYSLLPDKKPFAGTDIKKDVFKVFVGWAWDKLFRADFIKTNNITFQEQRTTNDMLFVFSAVVKADRISVIPDILAHYRREEGSLSVTRENSWHCFYDALTALKIKLADWNLYERFRQDYINYCVHFSLWNLETLSEPTHTILYNKLRDEWFSEMGVLEFGEDYFYNKKEYLQFRWIVENTADIAYSTGYKMKLGICIINDKMIKISESIKNNGIKYTINLIIRKIKQ